MAALSVEPSETWIVGDNLEWEVAAPQRLGLRSGTTAMGRVSRPMRRTDQTASFGRCPSCYFELSPTNPRNAVLSTLSRGWLNAFLTPRVVP
jgi:hypothetical protein